MKRKPFFWSALLLVAGAMTAVSCGQKEENAPETPAPTYSEAQVTPDTKPQTTPTTAPVMTPSVTPEATKEPEAVVTPTGDREDGSKEDKEEKNEPIVYFSAESGFYAGTLSLAMECPVEGAVIYYTLDGSIPDTNSAKYEEPLSLTNKSLTKNVLCTRKDLCVDSDFIPAKPVTKANIIRAAAYLPDGTVTPVANGTYFVGLNREKLYGDVPVISLITEQSNMFDYETGILVLGKTYDDWIAENPDNKNEAGWKSKGNFSNKGREWERPVYMEYIDKNGKAVYSADMGIRIKGASTRTYLQKSFRLIAREEYGTKNIKYKLIPGNMRSDGTEELKKYKSFVLRSGGNDCDYTKLRDPLLQTLISKRNMETQQYTPCVVFLDGEYWGVYTLVEDYTDNYIENNYGIDNNNVVIVKCGEIEEGEEEDISLFYEMYDFIVGNDMTVAENYEKAKTMLDMQGFIEYCAFQLYIYNEDSIFKNNNWSLWRVREADNATAWSDGQWRMMLYDTEYSTGLYCGGSNFDTDNISELFETTPEEQKENLTEYNPLEMFRSLYKNAGFRQELILTLCDIRNYDFEKVAAVHKMNDIAADYRKLIADGMYRYGPEWVILWNTPGDYYQQKLDELANFLNGRYDRFMRIMQKAFGLNTAVSVTLKVSGSEMGDVKINRTMLDFSELTSETFKGMYFTEYAITLNAVPKDGYRFVKWEVDGCSISDADSEEAVITLSDKCTITAVFEKK